MVRVRRWVFSFLAAAAVASGVAAGCGVEPVDADGCRKIESARCKVAPACPSLHVTDVDACQNFYRDQCLHGLAIDKDPGGPTIDRCVATIESAGVCAKAGDLACTAVKTTSGTSTACEVIEHPELAVDCAFLIPAAAPAAPTADAGGDAGSDAPAD